MNDELHQRILAWCGDNPSLRAEPLGVIPGSRFSIRIHTIMGQCQLNIPEGGIERIVLDRTVTPNAEQQQKLFGAGIDIQTMEQMLQGLVESRSSLISCTVERGGTGMTFRISHPVYADGLTRHSFLSALMEMDRFSKVIDLLLSSLTLIPDLERELDQTLSQVDQMLQGMGVTNACPSCGRTVPAGKKFCTYDGTRVT